LNVMQAAANKENKWGGFLNLVVEYKSTAWKALFAIDDHPLENRHQPLRTCDISRIEGRTVFVFLSLTGFWTLSGVKTYETNLHAATNPESFWNLRGFALYTGAWRSWSDDS
jgi:hypothetical protein